MAEEFNKDRLEAFFKRQLEHYEEDPGNAFWGELEQHIPAKPTPGIWAVLLKWWPSVLLLLALASLSTIIWFQQQKVSSLEQRLSQQRSQIQDLQDSLNTTTTTKAEHISANGIQELSSISGKTNNGSLISSFPEKIIIESRGTTGTIFSGPSLTLDSLFQQSGSMPLLDQYPKFFFGGSSSLSGENNYYTSFIENFEALQTSAAQLLNYSRKDTLPPAWWENDSAKFPYFYYGVGFTGGTSLLALPNPIEGSPFSSDYGYYLHAAIQFSNRWSVATGLQLGYKQLSFSYNTTFNYQPQGEPDQNGRFTHRYEEDADNYFRFKPVLSYQPANNGLDLEEGDPFDMNLSVDYQLRYIQIPLWIRYKLGDNRLAYEVQAGFVFNHLLGAKLDNYGTLFSDDRIELRSIDVEAIGLKSTFTEVGFGNTLLFDLNNAIQATVGFDLRYSLTPIFDDNTFSISGGLGLRYKF